MNGSSDRSITPHFRLAPTPSGMLHPGNVASFVLTWLLKHHSNGNLLLRIDDLDRERFRMEYLDDIFRTIDWLGIDYDRGPSGPDDFLRVWSQTERMPHYMELLSEIRESDRIYNCICSRSSLANGLSCNCYPDKSSQEEYAAWKFHTLKNEFVKFSDLMKGEISCDINLEMGDFAVRKKDKSPTYQITSLCDDIHFGITHVVRGEDLIPSTAAQLAMDAVLEFDRFAKSLFLHHPLITDNSGRKLSKSAGDAMLHKNNMNRSQLTSILQVVGKWLGIAEAVGTLNELTDASRASCRSLLGLNSR